MTATFDSRRFETIEEDKLNATYKEVRGVYYDELMRLTAEVDTGIADSMTYYLLSNLETYRVEVYEPLRVEWLAMMSTTK